MHACISHVWILWQTCLHECPAPIGPDSGHLLVVFLKIAWQPSNWHKLGSGGVGSKVDVEGTGGVNMCVRDVLGCVTPVRCPCVNPRS